MSDTSFIASIDEIGKELNYIHSIESQLKEIGDATATDMNRHIISDCQASSKANYEFVKHMTNNSNMCLRDALVVAYVLNDGLVMCTNGLNNAFHVQRNSTEDNRELELDSFERELADLTFSDDK